MNYGQIKNMFPAKIELCPECNSDKLVFPESRGRKQRNESRGIKWCCSDCGCSGFQSGCLVVVTRDGNQPPV